ncbi:MAG: hypothetical protein HQL17_07875 [Candidatus Omnitrophica bacterium]|nr:hypothetical protein [Candidatus Omnitrophota bacterium]
MVFAKAIDLKRLAALSQWDRIILTMIITCLMPLALHAIAFIDSPELGMRWLPMYYAPLMASILFRPHVVVIVGLCAPLFNHVLFGMPPERVMPGMMFELVVSGVIFTLLSQRIRVRAWHVIPAFILVRGVSLLIFSGTPQGFVDQLMRSLMTAWPGVLVLAVVAEVAGRCAGRSQ